MKTIAEYKDLDLVEIQEDIDTLLEEFKVLPKHSKKWKATKKDIEQRMNLYNEIAGFPAFVKMLSGEY